MFKTIKLWILRGIFGIAGLLILAGGIGTFYYRSEAASYNAKYVTAQANVNTLSAAITTQNQAIAKYKDAQTNLNKQLNQAVVENQKLDYTTKTLIAAVNKAKIGAKCSDAMSYLKSQAPSLVPHS